jgi:hypothetical protein
MKVEDARGGVEEYEDAKIREAAVRAGFSEGQAHHIEERVRERAWDGITTKKLHSIVYEEMKKLDEPSAIRYRLRDAIAALNPEFHEFEKYIAQVLEMEGIETHWSPRPKPEGECIDHEIDVVAEVDGTTYIVECKHHYHHHRYTGLDVPMRQWARLQDLRNGYEKGVEHALDVDEAWVVVNTKLSRHAKEYAACKDVRMTAWKYPEGEGLDAVVERHQAYPVTILDLPSHVRKELSKRNILTIQGLLGLDEEKENDLGLEEKVIDDIQRQARRLLD